MCSYFNNLNQHKLTLDYFQNSLVMMCYPHETARRHLLSADLKEQRQRWCTKINLALTNLRAWNVDAPLSSSRLPVHSLYWTFSFRYVVDYLMLGQITVYLPVSMVSMTPTLSQQDHFLFRISLHLFHVFFVAMVTARRVTVVFVDIWLSQWDFFDYFNRLCYVLFLGQSWSLIFDLSPQQSIHSRREKKKEQGDRCKE